MRQPNGATPNRWFGGECAGKRRDRNWRGMRRSSETTPNWWRLGGECASQMEQHQISGSSAGNALAKWNNTKSVDPRQMRRRNGTTPIRWIGGEYAGQTEQHQIGGSAANAPANERECGVAMRCAGRTATPNRWAGGECAGETEQHQIGGLAANTPAKWNNTKLVDRRRMRRQMKENAARR